MEMFNLREDYKTLPDETLRKFYRNLVKRQRRLAAVTFAFIVPAMLVYGMMGWVNFLVAEWNGFAFFDTSSNAFFNYVAFAACGALLMADTAKLIAASPAVMILYMGLKFGLFDSVSGDTFAMLAYLIIAAAVTTKTVSDLNFMRKLPNFPFDGRKERIDFEGLTRDKMTENLQKTLDQQNGDKVITNDYEDIFTSDNPQDIADPPENTDDYMQQHKMTYQRIKSWNDVSRLD
ncbi:hypothetical protein [Ruminococcus sp.]|uniref:hypothetical protein n=1 Tax=Ruminococcus sp. TaxID=41978 RepID=UPI0025DEEC2D|nr:hypothetical protein [uncultured Ruminococcus sp.]